MVGTGRAAVLGVLFKGGEVLERSQRVDTVVFDKTGTLTTGRMALVGNWVAPGTTPDHLLAMATAAEAGSDHPVAAALTAAARDRGVERPVATGFESIPGMGVRALVEGHVVSVGRPGWFRTRSAPEAASSVGPAQAAPSSVGPAPAAASSAGLAPEATSGDDAVTVSAAAAAAVDGFEGDGATAVVVAWDGQARGVLAVADTLRPEAAEVVSRLHRLGMRVVMLTGDNHRTADAMARAAGIDEVLAEVLPADKLAEIRRLQADGRRVAMVGDGVNDAPALVQADLGIAIGTGAGAAMEAADVTLMSADLGGVPQALDLARATYTTILQNLGWAFGYNLAAIPLAAFGLLNPALAGAAMGLSSVSVVANSLRLTRFRPAVAHRGREGATRRRSLRARRSVAVAAAWVAPTVLFGGIALTSYSRSAAANRIDATVVVRMSEFRFTPSAMTVHHGERVRFVFTNVGSTEHEAFIGDAAGQDAHESAMRMGGSHHDHSGDEVDVAPGKTGELTYRFSQPGAILVGCHLPGHYAAGMRATVTVT
jgi:cation-transporting ATPase V